jgi:hypothetical protein
MIKRLGLVLVSSVLGVDDSTMSLLANVDPVNVPKPASSKVKASSLIQNQATAMYRDDTFVPIKGIQSSNLAKLFKYTPPAPVEKRRVHVAPRIHLVDTAKTAAKPDVKGDEKVKTVPDVLICHLPGYRNGLSVRTCDSVKKSPALLAQVLRCSERMHPSTIADLMMARQTSPIDLSVDEATANATAANMDTPLSIDMSFGACDGDRAKLPDLDTTSDYLVFVTLNPDVERAAENFSLQAGASQSYRTGTVFVSIPKLFDPNIGLKNVVAGGFTDGVEHCMDDGVCSAAELVQWVNDKYATHVDFIVGSNQGIARLSK